MPGIDDALEAIKEFFEERAAIREYCAPMTRNLAERFAAQDVKSRFGLTIAVFDKDTGGRP